ncbi:Saposin-like_type B domin-containing protein [Hexamita inflata]|uniref:Saposin-like type B domin-containing protein n=1 Tax=Hexamita inflata TaxID=28002 RepID=A0AA86N8J3_9EUKA|nr:Saposin-like type B domin-containing protein [Hexamita inflata]
MISLLSIILSQEVEPKQLDLMCDVCIIAVDSVYSYVEDVQNEKAVEDFLDDVCQYIPFDFFNWCEQLIAKYYEQLVEAVLDGYPPYELCKSLTLC